MEPDCIADYNEETALNAVMSQIQTGSEWKEGGNGEHDFCMPV